MWRALLYKEIDRVDDQVLATLRAARSLDAGSELPLALLSLVRDGLRDESVLSESYQRPDAPRGPGPVAKLEWMIEVMNAEALRSIAVLYFEHGVCCHTLGRLWNQEPHTIIARMERGYGLRGYLPTDGKPWKVATDAELDAIVLHESATQDAAARFQLFSFAPRLYPVPDELWARIDAELSR